MARKVSAIILAGERERRGDRVPQMGNFTTLISSNGFFIKTAKADFNKLYEVPGSR